MLEAPSATKPTETTIFFIDSFCLSRTLNTLDHLNLSRFTPNSQWLSNKSSSILRKKTGPTPFSPASLESTIAPTGMGPTAFLFRLHALASPASPPCRGTEAEDFRPPPPSCVQNFPTPSHSRSAEDRGRVRIKGWLRGCSGFGLPAACAAPSLDWQPGALPASSHICAQSWRLFLRI